MEFESYADVIDSYNSGVGVEAGESLTDYIKRNNIQIKEISMDPMGDFEKILKGSRPMEKEGIMQASAKTIDPRVTMEAIVEEFIKRKKRRPRSIDELKEFYFEMSSGGKEMAGEMEMAKYMPGNYSQEDLDAYENYKYNMNEQMPGFPIMEIDDFLRMEEGQARAGVAVGGLPGILGV
jgi:hypothetical protein